MNLKPITAVTLAGALTVTTAGAAPQPDSSEDQVFNDVDHVLEEFDQAQVAQAPNPDASEVEVSDGVVSAETSTGETVQIELPGKPVDQASSLESLSIESEGEGYSTLVEHLEDGSFRNLIHIDSPQATTDFDFVVPEGFALEEETDGSVTIRDDEGTSVGFLQQSWAVDADGADVPVEYAVEGRTLIKTVHHTATTAYPVVADPIWIPALKLVATMSKHAIAQAGARGISQNVINRTIQNGARTAGNNNTSIFTSGKGANKIRVIVNNSNGNVVTVTKG